MVKGITQQAVERYAVWVQIEFIHLLASLHLCLKCKMRNDNNNLKKLLKGINQLHVKDLA